MLLTPNKTSTARREPPKSPEQAPLLGRGGVAQESGACQPSLRRGALEKSGANQVPLAPRREPRERPSTPRTQGAR